MPATRTKAHIDADSGTPARGHLIVTLVARWGHRLSMSIAERLGDPGLAANIPVLVLCELAMRGPLRPRDLMEATHLTSGGMTKQIEHLESLGLIERTFGALEDDRRATVVTLTPEGARAAAVIEEAIEADLDQTRSVVATLAALLDD
jgi:DNA-binding MarR family transcriptional regulator